MHAYMHGYTLVRLVRGLEFLYQSAFNKGASSFDPTSPQISNMGIDLDGSSGGGVLLLVHLLLQVLMPFLNKLLYNCNCLYTK